MARGKYRPPGGDITLTHSGGDSPNTRHIKILRDEDGAMRYRPGLAPMLSPPQAATPSNLFELTPPEIEVPLGFQSFVGGSGFEEIGSGETNALRVYNYSQGVDLSWGDRTYLSPLLQTGGAVTSTNPKKFVWSEELGLFTINDRFVYEWTGSAWTERLDVGSGGLINDLFEYTNSTDTYLVVALQGVPYQYSTDGIVWITEANASSPTLRSLSNATSASATSVSLAMPAGTVDDDIMLATIVTGNTEAVSAPSDWNLIQQTTTTHSMFTFWRRAASDSGPYVFSWTSATNTRGNIVTYQSARTSGSPIDVSGINVGETGTSHDAPSVTTIGPNRRLITIFGSSADAGLHTPPAGQAEQIEQSSSDGSIGLNDSEQAVAGASGIKTSIMANSVTGHAVTLAFYDDPAGAFDVARFLQRGASSGEPLLWALDSIGDLRNTFNPTLPSSWSNADTTQVGQQASAIAGIELIDNIFYIFRDTEIVSYDGTTVSTVFSSPTFKLKTGASQPLLWVDGNIYFTYNSTLYQFQQLNNVITPVWPPEPGNSELNGTVTAITGDDHHLFFSVKNVAGNTYIMKGDPRRPLMVGTKTVYPFHTLAYRATNDADALLVVPADSDAMHSANSQLVLADGNSADYFILPRDGLRPEDDSNVRFETAVNQLAYGPFVDWGARAMNKFLNRGVIIGDDWDSNDTVTLQYQVPGGTATTIVTGDDTTGDKAEAAVSAEVEFQTLRYKALFNNGATTTTPILQGFALYATLNPPRKRIWSFDVEIGASGTDPNKIDMSDWLFKGVNSRATFLDRWGASFSVKILAVEGLAVIPHEVSDNEILTVTLVEI